MWKILYFYEDGSPRKPTRMHSRPATKSFSCLTGLLFCFLLLAAIQACEKDDICVEADTPLLVVSFFNSDSPEEKKGVTRLRVIGLGQEQVINTFNDRSTLDSIGIPLRIDSQRTGFVFIFQSEDSEDGEETGNRDTVYFDYTTREEFTSRACGFVVRYEGLTAERTADQENWIDSVRVTQASVISSDSTHVSIFH